jgi:alanyl aminopeptidase
MNYSPLTGIRATLPLIAALGGSLFAAGETAPKLRLSEAQDIVPVRYRVELTLDPAKDKFSGVIAIQMDLHKPAQTVWLNANQIVAQSASAAAGGKTWPARPLDGGGDFLGLAFESPLPAGPAEITIHYEGSVRDGTSGVFRAKDSGYDYILTQFESTDGRDAFPCFDEPAYKTPWQLTVHVPAQDTAVSNTPVASEKTEGALKTIVFQQTKPLPSYLVAFGVGPFEFVDAGFAGRNRAPVRIVTPKGRAEEAKYAAEVTATILTRLEQYFGIPFPYEKSDQVAVPVSGGFGAMENAGMVTYGQNIILAKPATDTISRQRGYAIVAAHELSHQWFGDLVTTNWWDDIWLNEAFATWMEHKLIAEWKPEWETRVADVNSKLGAEDQDSLVTARMIRQEIATKDDIANAFDDITYEKGAAVIGMFEAWMGPEDFRKGVQGYLNRYAFRNATAGDFLDSLGSATKKDIAKPFATFLNQAGTPLVSVSLDCGPKPPVVHLEQTRYLPTGSQGGAAVQAWSVPICLRYDGGGAQADCTLVTAARYDWPLKGARGCPAWVNANADATGYYMVDYRGGLLAALTRGAAANLRPQERVDLIGNVTSMEGAGKVSAADALSLVEVFHNDPEREVVVRALGLAVSIDYNLVPENLAPNYRRFLLQNFQARARELGWLPKAGESEDSRLLRPPLLRNVAIHGGDADLTKEARTLAEKWLSDHSAIPAEITAPVLMTAASGGDAALFNRYLAAFQKTQDRQEKQRLVAAMGAFHDRAAIDAGLQAFLTKAVPLVDGLGLLRAGQAYGDTRNLSFQFIKEHYEQITAGNPSIFGNDLGSFLPFAGGSFCDAPSRREEQEFFAPLVDKYTGAPRNLAQVLESIDLCIAQKAAQQDSVKAFLEKY